MNDSRGRIWIGAILMIIGGLFLLENLNFPWFFEFDLHHLIFSWHSFFIIIGVILIINHSNHIPGYIFLAIGLFGLLKHFVPFLFNLDYGDLWPIIILFIGLWLILKRNERTSYKQTNLSHGPNPFPNSGQTQYSEGMFDSIDDVAVFNSMKKINNSQNFRGGKLTSIFGSIKLDLTNAKLAPGENILEITMIFGGVDIRVPQDMKVSVNVTSVFGGFDDKRFASYNTQTGDGVLIIRGAAIFGGGDILY